MKINIDQSILALQPALTAFRRDIHAHPELAFQEVQTAAKLAAHAKALGYEVTAGGGGIPVVDDKGTLKGIEAVIDKDRASALLAGHLGVERFIISTDVDRVYLNYNTPHRFALAAADLAMAKGYLAEGHFAEGSMKPKVQAAVTFVEGGGIEAIITDPEHLVEALEGHSGTHIIREHTHEPAPHR